MGNEQNNEKPASNKQPAADEAENTSTGSKSGSARWHRWLPALKSAILYVFASTAAIVHSLRGKPAPDGTKRKSWLVFIVPSLPVLMLSTYAVHKALTTDVFVRDFVIPQKLKDEGFDPAQALRTAFGNIPNRLRDVKEQNAEQRTRGVYLLELTKIGDEAFCSPNPTPLQAGVVKALFDETNPVSIQLEGKLETKLFEQLGMPLQSFLEWIKRQFGSPYVAVDLTVLTQGDGYQLQTTISVIHRSLASAPQRRFISPARIPDAARLAAAIEETLLRITYPEISALLRAARGSTGLDIEEFLTEYQHTAHREFALGLWRATAALNNPNYASRGANLFEALAELDQLLVQSANGKNGAMADITDLALFSYYLQAELIPIRRAYGLPDWDNGQRCVMDELCEEIEKQPASKDKEATLRKLKDPRLFYHDAIIRGLEQKAKKDGYSLQIDAAAGMQNLLKREARQYLDQKFLADSAFSKSDDLTAINEYKARLERVLNFVSRFDERTCCGDASIEEARAAIHDTALLFIETTAERALGLLGDPKTQETARTLLTSLVQLHDEHLTRAARHLRPYTPQEVAALEATIALAQLVTGDINDALRRLNRAANGASPCSLASIGNKLLTASQALKDSAPERSRNALIKSNEMLRKATDTGAKNLSIYNLIGHVSSLLGDTDQAFEAYRAALTYDGDHAWIMLNKGFLHLQLNEFEQAEVEYRNSLDSGEVYMAIRGLLSALAAQGDVKEFVRTYEKYQDRIFKFDTDSVEMGRILIHWHCTGAIEKVPDLSDAAKAAYPAGTDGKFACSQ